ncbi:unnamed protein product [Phytomonas sp. EM1]|nr:unnamed protein product [Phytomonas sp. EM1]|eukprot:CCW62881.1 unnamed protein product [Phytomonas sp. isolate EM1]
MGRASKDKRDIYYRKAKEEGYRARSAYKLLQIHEEFNILDPRRIRTGVVDLCAAPGSWSQVLAAKLHSDEAVDGEKRSRREDEADIDSREGVGGGEDATSSNHNRCHRRHPVIIAVDLQEMAPIEGVCILQGDITSAVTAREIIRLLNEHHTSSSAEEEEGEERKGEKKQKEGMLQRRAELVVCDGAPDVTGMHELDEYLQHHLLLAALNLATFVLCLGGCTVSKIFRGPNTGFLIAKCEMFFREVRVVKPKSSRNASMEGFLVCQGFFMPEGYVPRFLTGGGAPTPSVDPAKGEADRGGYPGDVFTEASGALHAPDYAYAAALGDPSAFEKGEETQQQQIALPGGGGATTRVILPFLSCGDLSGYDADMCYDLEEGGEVLSPVQPPLMAPYLSTTAP